MRLLIAVACLTALFVEMSMIVGSSAGASTGQGAHLATLQQQLQAKRPEIVFVGNSILLNSTDEGTFSSLSGRKTWILGQHGSASAWWYLALKNVILAPRMRHIPSEEQRPRLVVFFFRDCALTDPGFRVTGEYEPAITAMSAPDEPVLDALAYQGTMNAITYMMFRHCPLYRHRHVVRQELGFRIKREIVPWLLGACDDVEHAVNRTFADENLDAELLTMRQLAAASGHTDEACDFQTRLGRSFLPHVIGLARKNGVQIAFVRMKRRRDVTPQCEPPALVRYIGGLKAYLAENQVPLIDLTHETEITADLYGAGDHLRETPAIRGWFTALLAERLAPVLEDLPR